MKPLTMDLMWLEAGTLNAHGIAGLSAGKKKRVKIGMSNLSAEW